MLLKPRVLGLTEIIFYCRHPNNEYLEHDMGFLGEDSIPGSGRSLENEMAAHFHILAWEIPWTEELGGMQSMGSQKSWTRLSD